MENPEIDEYGNKFWRNEKGEYHREDGPAVEYINGTKEWWINGKLHRIDGTAVEGSIGYKYWYIEGKEYTEEEYNKKISEMNNKNPKIDSYGTKRWFNEKGERHRIDGPAVEWCNGTKEWWVNGKFHRLDGPAVEGSIGYKYWYIEGKQYTEEDFNKKISEMNINKKENPKINEVGDKLWYKNGKLHREDGPAIEWYNGYKFWYIEDRQYTEEEFNKKVSEINITKKENPEIDEEGNKFWRNEKGELHRIDGPAIEYSNGTKYWYINGKCHREDGPAVEYSNEGKAWYIEGIRYNEEEYNKKISEINITKKENPEIDEYGTKRWINEKGEYHRLDGPAIEYTDGYKAWWIHGKRHRIDGPAIEYANGDKSWYVNDELHRLNGPAIEWINGYKAWYINGEFHREDGPAVEYTNGDKEWYVNGKLHREDGPAVEEINGYKSWLINGNYHRIDGPALENINGTKAWWIHGKRHRIDGPAIEYVNGDGEWWIEGNKYTEEEFNKKISEINLTKETNNKTTKEEKTMKDIIKDRFEQASYRTAGRQMTKGIAKAIVKAAETKGMDNSSVAVVSKFFETEIGESLIGMLLGVGLPYIPKFNKDKRVQKLAEEFQVESASRAADIVLDEAMQYFLPVVGDVLKALPEENKRLEMEDEEEQVVINKVSRV